MIAFVLDIYHAAGCSDVANAVSVTAVPTITILGSQYMLSKTMFSAKKCEAKIPNSLHSPTPPGT